MLAGGAGSRWRAKMLRIGGMDAVGNCLGAGRLDGRAGDRVESTR
jgi:hypothetical protein